jgi:DNA modification methylase
MSKSKDKPAAIEGQAVENRTVPVASCSPHPGNYNRHDEGQIADLRLSLRRFHQVRSIVAQDDGAGGYLLVAGHGVWEAARLEGFESLRADVIPADWSPARVLAYLAADNELAKRASPDEAQLAALVVQVQAEADEELARLAAGGEEAYRAVLAGLQEPKADPGPQIDRAEELQAKWNVQRGQVWQIGRHRLMCGDSTNGEDVGQLMEAEKAVLFNTDPPYGCNAGNIGFTAQRDDIEAITKDDLEGREMQAWLESVFHTWIPYLADDCAWYLWHPMLTQGYFAAAAAAADLIIHRQIIWKKEQFIFGRGDYHWRHELCFYGWRQGHRPPFYGNRNQDTVWDIAWGEKRSDVGHPTAKPIELFAIPMRNHARAGSVCAEPFAGSGSQFVAAEQVGCSVRGMEIEPKYCAVTLERLAGIGLEPRLVES